jgi:hypothetical protein
MKLSNRLDAAAQAKVPGEVHAKIPISGSGAPASSALATAAGSTTT